MILGAPILDDIIMFMMTIENDDYLFFFSVPFDEDDKDASVWYLDHDYLDNMSVMFKKVNGENSISFVKYQF